MDLTLFKALNGFASDHDGFEDALHVVQYFWDHAEALEAAGLSE